MQPCKNTTAFRLCIEDQYFLCRTNKDMLFHKKMRPANETHEKCIPFAATQTIFTELDTPKEKDTLLP